MGVPASALRVSGEVRTYELTAASGNVASRGVCPRCGSPIFFTTSGLPDVIFLAAGSLDNPALFEPSVVVFAASAQPWDIMDSALQRFPRMPE